MAERRRKDDSDGLFDDGLFGAASDALGAIPGVAGAVVGRAAKGLDRFLGPIDEIAGDIVGGVAGEVAPAFKGFTRTATAGLIGYSQEFSNFVRWGAMSAETLDWAPYEDAGTSFWRTKADLGQGWLPGEEASEEVELRGRKQEWTGGHGAHFGGADNPLGGVSVGRMVGSYIFEPGSTGYNVLSGLLDMAVVIGTDPATAVGGASKSAGVSTRVAKAGRALRSGTKAVEEGADTAAVNAWLAAADAAGERGLGVPPAPWDVVDPFRSAGLETVGRFAGAGAALRTNPLLVPRPSKGVQAGLAEFLGKKAGLSPSLRGGRNRFDPNKGAEWLVSTPEGRNVMKKLAATDNVHDIREATRKKIPVAVMKDLAKAKTPEEVQGVLLGGDAPILGATVRELPEFLTYKVTKSNRGGIRLFQGMPNNMMDPDDADDMVETIDRVLRNAKVSPEVRKLGINRVAEVSGRSKKEVEGVLSEVMADVAVSLVEREIRIRDRGLMAGIKAAGSDERSINMAEAAITDARRGRARELTQMFNKDFFNKRKYFGDEMNANRTSMNLAVGGRKMRTQTPSMYVEYLDGMIPMPNARELRRATSTLAPMIDNIFYENLADKADMFQGIWKRTVLLRGAYTVRVIGEEQLRMAAAGYDSIVHHPISFVSSLISDTTKVPKKVMGAAEAAGQAAHEAFLVENAVTETTKATAAIKVLEDNKRVLKAGIGAKTKLGPLDVEALRDAKAILANPNAAVRKGTYGGSPAFDKAYSKVFDDYRQAQRDAAAAKSPLRRKIAGMKPGNRLQVDKEGVPFHDFSTGGPGSPELGGALNQGWNGAVDEGVKSGHYEIYSRPKTAAQRQNEAVARVKAAGGTNLEAHHEGLVALNEGGEGGSMQQFRDAWANAIGRSHEDPVHRMLAQALTENGVMSPLTPNGVKAVKNEFWDGSLANVRVTIMKADNTADITLHQLASPEGSDQYVDYMLEGLTYRAGGGRAGKTPGAITPPDEAILRMIATGETPAGAKIFKYDKSGKAVLDPDVKVVLREATKAERAPDVIVGPASIKNASADKKLTWDKATGWAFSILNTRPTNYLSRSPVFRQAYWLRIEEMIPYMDEATRADYVQRAAGVVSDRALKRMKLSAETALPFKAQEAGVPLTIEAKIIRESPADMPTGQLSDLIQKAKREARVSGGVAAKSAGADWDGLAKAHALDVTKNLLYDASQRSQFFDAYRIVFPFGEAWREVMTRWVKLSVENPNVPNVGARTIMGARGEGAGFLGGEKGKGFFHKDENGNEIFSYPFSKNLVKLFTGIPDTPLTASVAGLSFSTDVMPGVGPVIQLASAALVPETPDWAWMKKAVSPFGEADYSSGVLESFAPGWLKKVMMANGVGNDRVMGNSVNEMMAHLVQLGDRAPGGGYDLTDKSDMQRLMDNSLHSAKYLYILRGMTQFVAPSAPTPIFLATLPSGEVVTQRAIIKDFQKLQSNPEEGGVGYDNAVPEFLNRYGPKFWLLMQSKSKGLTYETPTTDASADWELNNPDIVRDYGQVWGMFAEKGDSDKFNFQAYNRQFDRGERVALSPEQFLAMGQGRLGWHIWDQQQKRLPKKRTPEQTAWLAAVKQRIIEEYPGFATQYEGLPQKADPELIRAELRQAVLDPRLSKNPISKPVLQYLEARDRALAEARRRGFTTLNGGGAADLRVWLLGVANGLRKKQPKFSPIFDRVFSREVEN